MYLSRHQTEAGIRWAADGRLLPPSMTLSALLELPQASLAAVLAAAVSDDDEAAPETTLAPIDADQEVWASGVTYLRSREAREEESETSADAYAKVYDADRPELFAKAAGWRVVGSGSPIRIRKDSQWNVPEPELTLVINRHGEIVGYCAGNDVSSRDIEGENPLYLPQAKVYNGSCALGPGIQLAEADDLHDLLIQVTIKRGDKAVFAYTRDLDGDRARLELLVPAAPLDHTQHVERTEVGGEQVVPGAEQAVPAGRERGVRWVAAIARVHGREEREESVDVLGGPVVDDVDVMGRERRALCHGGERSDEDELSARRREAGDQRRQVGGLRRHGGAPGRLGSCGRSGGDAPRA